MKKHFKIYLMNFIAFMSVSMVLITCKKGEDPQSSDPTAPTATTNSAVWVGRNWATMKGTINANGQFTTVSFEYDTTTTYGNSINANPDTMSGSSNINVSFDLTGLSISTKYHYRVKAVSSAGTTYGNDVTFTTSDTGSTVITFNPDLIYGSVSDNDGNSYKTIQIGTQTWMAENLKTTKYNDGTVIPFVTDVTGWGALSAPGYCWYNNYSISYGAMYNWYTVNSGKLCPMDWHVPSDVEWTALTDYLGGESVAADKLKETGTTHWLVTKSGVNNESGFTALPSGYRSYAGTFNSIRSYGYWWSSTGVASAEAYYRDINYGYVYVDRSSSNKRSGFSVRCIKD